MDDGSFFLQLDDSTTLLPINVASSPFGEKEVRALVNYDEVDEVSGRYSKTVHINWIDSILTKPIAPDLGEENDVVYGTDPVEIVRDWVTIAEDGYLTLRFRTEWGDRSEPLKLKWKSFDGDKSAEFDYCTRKGTPAASSAILSQRSILKIQ